MVGPSLISLYNLYPTATHRRRSGARLQFGRSHRRDGADRRPDPAARHRLRMDRHVVPGKDRSATRSSTCSGSRCCWSICASPASTKAGSRRCRVILAVPLSLIGPADRADRSGCRQQPLHPDRPRAADRADREKRHPDRRGGARAAHRRRADPHGGGRRGAHAVPSHPHDVLRLHSGRGAAGDRNRRRRQRARLARACGGQRHARLDLSRGAVRAVVLCRVQRFEEWRKPRNAPSPALGAV